MRQVNCACTFFDVGSIYRLFFHFTESIPKTRCIHSLRGKGIVSTCLLDTHTRLMPHSIVPQPCCHVSLLLLSTILSWFRLLEALYVFISGLAVHVHFINFQKSRQKNPIELKRSCETRWACRSSTIDAVYGTFPFVIEILK